MPGCYGDSVMNVLGVVSPLLVYARDFSKSPESSVLSVIACWASGDPDSAPRITGFPGDLRQTPPLSHCGNENTTCAPTPPGETIKILVPGSGFLVAQRSVQWDIITTSINQRRIRRTRYNKLLHRLQEVS